jgi:hypothetical protein
MFCPLSFVVAGYFSENRLLAGASEHNLLATTHDVGVLTNFGTFALMLETSLQSVDPMLAVSFHSAGTLSPIVLFVTPPPPPSLLPSLPL